MHATSYIDAYMTMHEMMVYDLIHVSLCACMEISEKGGSNIRTLPYVILLDFVWYVLMIASAKRISLFWLGLKRARCNIFYFVMGHMHIP